MTVLKAWQLINSPDKWTTGSYARDTAGKPVEILDDKAVKFCALGAIYRSYGPSVGVATANSLGYSFGGSVSEWNDRSEWQTVYDTLKRLDI